MAAIRLLKQLEADGRLASSEEQAVLNRYTGWGGIPQAFDGQRKGWEKEYAELKELLSDTEYAAARASTLNAHYTPYEIIKAIYAGFDDFKLPG